MGVWLRLQADDHSRNVDDIPRPIEVIRAKPKHLVVKFTHYFFLAWSRPIIDSKTDFLVFVDLKSNGARQRWLESLRSIRVLQVQPLCPLRPTYPTVAG